MSKNFGNSDRTGPGCQRTKVAALENGGHNIGVNAVAPGTIDTPMLQGFLQASKLTEVDYAPPLSLLNRFGKPNEVA